MSSKVVLAVLLCIGGVLSGCGGEPQTVGEAVGPSSMAEMGIPPTPDAATWAAFIAELNAIDPAIVGGKEERAVDRARNQCSSVKEWPDDEAKLIALTNQRFTAPSHPEGFGEAKSKRILAAVRKHICPTY